jgi:hypothetical protein
LFITGCLALYVAALALFTYYSCQNSQPARAVADLVESPAVTAGWRELADAVCGPRPEEVSDVREG